MDLFERYLLELSTYLPKDLRDPVCEELRGQLSEELENRLVAAAGKSTRDLEIEILEELGPPHLYADSHVPRPRVLFGPRLYPAFFRTLKIAIAALVALAALGVWADYSASGSLLSLGPALLAALRNVLTGSLVVIGIAVVVFAMIERSSVAQARVREQWDPRTLSQPEDPDKISVSDQVFSIAFLIVALIVVNLYSDRIGALVTLDGDSGWVPLLGPAFRAGLWLLNLALVLDLAVAFVVLARWRWSPSLRWAKFAVNCLYVAWLGTLTWNPPLIAVDPEWMISHGWSAESAAEYRDLIESNFARWINRNMIFAFVAACLGLVYSLFKVLRSQFADS